MSPGVITGTGVEWEIGDLKVTDTQWDEFSTAMLYMASRTKNLTWLGAEVCQLPTDLMTYQEIITEVRPELVIETGTFCGGSARFMQAILALLGYGGQVLSIDVGRHPDLVVTPGVTYWVGGESVEPELVEKVTAMASDKRTLVLLDSDHSTDYVRRELDAYAPRVSLGSYLIVADTHFTNGPKEALAQWLPAHPEFAVDRSRERFGATLNRGGFLKRVA